VFLSVRLYTDNAIFISEIAVWSCSGLLLNFLYPAADHEVFVHAKYCFKIFKVKKNSDSLLILYFKFNMFKAWRPYELVCYVLENYSVSSSSTFMSRRCQQNNNKISTITVGCCWPIKTCQKLFVSKWGSSEPETHDPLFTVLSFKSLKKLRG
jgi:hypothetical protein